MSKADRNRQVKLRQAKARGIEVKRGEPTESIETKLRDAFARDRQAIREWYVDEDGAN